MSVSPIQVQQIILHHLKMQLKSPFSTSFGTMQDKEFFVIEMIDEDGIRGYGESVAFVSPWYTEETVKTTEHMMVDFLIPLLFQAPINHPDEVSARFSVIRRNNMAKAALEGAVWDLYARRQNQSLAHCLGGTKREIEVGISIGIQPSTKDLLQVIEKSLLEGYKRIKIKIKPNHDIDVLREVRREFPHIPLMVDANSAYTLEDKEYLRRFDEFKLLMIEQPLGHADIIEHARLQKELQTPICLDESIYSLDDVRMAVELGSCKIINVKIGRVGGLTETKKINDYCKKHEIPVWCGGMLEAGIGRAHNIAVTTLDQFILPGDTSASNRYWQKDIIEPEVTMDHGMIKVPTGPGIGYNINWQVLEEYRIDRRIFRRER
ncbi:o-succinylbenzoate synthase [Robertmurraya andreesenii]|uniref:o-succinylbenzoate synthase n=1 Tax=Anoxybacillus andreesenii TaxID=1325932 RepID=A0ABT9V3S8_9BACL|nr:o-succinylbenzoate synthase [Robertmurraya andreesenii]MDQ0155505.1 O-succinylbenzoate synthase [Robertmurraya andreesenii]